MSHRRNYRKPALAVLVALSAVGRTAASTGIAEDAQDTLVDDLNDLDEYDLQGTCSLLKQSFGTDVCGSLDQTVDFGSITDSRQNAAPICFNFDFQPDANGNVVAYDSDTLNEYAQFALFTDPVDCFAAFNYECEYTYDSSEERKEAFGNWTQSFAALYTYDQLEDSVPVLPDCFSFIIPSDLVIKALTGYVRSGPPAKLNPSLPGANTTVPNRVDWQAANMTMEVTDQAGGTCYMHAAVGWFASWLLMTGTADASNQFSLDAPVTLSVQPVVDCEWPAEGKEAPCDGGQPQDVVQAMADYGTVKDSLYPALHGANASAVTNANQCANAPAKARCDVLANNTQLYKLPQDVYNQMSPQSLSESQIVQALNDGPIIAGIAAGDLLSTWHPYDSKKKPTPFNGTFARSAKPKVSEFCSNEINHAVLLIGYDISDPENSYLIFRNSWGLDQGDRGNFFARLSNPNSDQFQDPNYNGTCGLTTDLFL